MCGLAGYLAASGWSRAELGPRILQRMADKIVSRGPDDSGTWDEESGIGLAHRRLSILDLSSAGHQPMMCSVGRYVVVFNGEIYNHLDLRRELEQRGRAPVWRGHSDTETLLAGFAAWGIKATVTRSVGMFAFAVWDRREHVLTLGRDRLGEKPLYYGWLGGGDRACFVFGSELKALKVHPSFDAGINRGAVSLLMRHSYIPAPYSIYDGIFKLPAGSLLSVSLTQREPVIERYWSLVDVASSGQNSPFHYSAEETVDELERVLKCAIRQQMISDVPLGAFLSGGIDSSAVVALMQAQSDRPVKTFTIGFNEQDYNEAIHAKAVAKHLGTDHTELYVTAEQALDVIPKLPTIYCEPFADSSQIPTFLVSHLARQRVTVSLSGDGGDELFAGYNRYVMASNVWKKISYMPQALRGVMAQSARVMSPAAWNRLLGPLQDLGPRSISQINFGEKLHKAGIALAARDIDELYLGFVTHWEPEKLIVDNKEPTTCLRGYPPLLHGLSGLQRMMALDAITYLPDDILVKVDRAAMGVSLETRVPFLDHRVVEFAWKIPQSMKLHDGISKWILRRLLYRYVPATLVERPKMGFGVPIDTWLRGPLRDWAEALLNENRLRREGFFNPELIRVKWLEHLTGRCNWQYLLWDVLMFQAWLDEQTN